MPVYEYAHKESPCELGEEFVWTQSIKDDRLAACPKCGGPVERLISRPQILTPKSDTDLRNMGFTKLVKRETGVYENVTRRGSESRYMEAGKPETTPDLSKIVSD